MTNIDNNSASQINKNARRTGLFVNAVRILAGTILIIIAYKYFYQDLKLTQLKSQLIEINSVQKLSFLLFALILMPFNWFFEGLKWRSIINFEFPISSLRALKSVIQGTSLGIITPGRIGEYGGRVLNLPAEHRAFGAVATFVCSLAQNMINIIGGLIAFSILSTAFLEPFVNPQIFIAFLIMLLILIVAVYFNIHWLLKKLHSLKFFNNFQVFDQWLDFSSRWKRRDQFKLFYYSSLRYLIYLLQYFLMLLAFSIDIHDYRLVGAIMILFSVQTVLPLTPILQFAIRGSLAIAIIGTISNLPETLLISSYAIWVLNLLIPSIVGALSLLVIKKRKAKIKS